MKPECHSDYRKLRIQPHAIRVETAPKDSLRIAGIVLDMRRGECIGEVIKCGEDHFGERAAAAAHGRCIDRVNHGAGIGLFAGVDLRTGSCCHADQTVHQQYEVVKAVNGFQISLVAGLPTVCCSHAPEPAW